MTVADPVRHRHLGDVLHLGRGPAERHRRQRRAVARVDLAAGEVALDLGHAERHAGDAELAVHLLGHRVVAPAPDLLVLEIGERLDLVLREEVDRADVARLTEEVALLLELLLEMLPHLLADVVHLLDVREHHGELEHGDARVDHREARRGDGGAVELTGVDLADVVDLVTLAAIGEVLDGDAVFRPLADLHAAGAQGLLPLATGGGERGHAQLDIVGGRVARGPYEACEGQQTDG
jgi:hypothetical protein